MTSPQQPLPLQVLEALAQGNQIEAIKRLRAVTGLGLKEAKDLTDRHLQGRPVSMPAAPSDPPLPPEIVAALRKGDKVAVIKYLRAHSGKGLKEAKDMMEAMARQSGEQQNQLAPGEMPRAAGKSWWLVGLGLAALALYFYLRHAGS